MARVLVVTPEPIARRLAGPAIRAAQIARVLSDEHEVVLLSLAGDSISPIDGQAVLGPDALGEDGNDLSALGDLDAAVVQGSTLVRIPELAESSMPLVIDWFDPFHVEALHRSQNDRIRRIDLIEGARSTLEYQAERGDFFICSNDMQREHWLGWLAAAGRLNHLAHDADPLFESLIAVAPFGIGRERPGGGTPIRNTFSVIGHHDPVILWQVACTTGSTRSPSFGRCQPCSTRTPTVDWCSWPVLTRTRRSRRWAFEAKRSHSPTTCACSASTSCS